MYELLSPRREPVVNAQTGTTYALVAADAYPDTSMVTLSNAAAITVTVPKQATTDIAVGQIFNLQQVGAGQVTFAAEDGDVTINPAGTLKIATQWGAASLVKTATNVWSLIGALSA
jgi:geranylgeranyl pyrophosphate synthase